MKNHGKAELRKQKRQMSVIIEHENNEIQIMDDTVLQGQDQQTGKNLKFLHENTEFEQHAWVSKTKGRKEMKFYDCGTCLQVNDC